MLQRVISITNVGRFRNSASQPNPPFNRRTLVFAPNAYGKTTFCAIMRSLQRGEPNYILARRTLGSAQPPAVNLLWDGAQRQFQNGAWPAPEPRISIFDGTFVAENVHSGDIVDVANRRNLYRVIVGSNGVGLAEEEARLAEEARQVQSNLGPVERALQQIAGGLALRQFDALPQDPALDQKLADLRQQLEAHRASAAIAERPLLANAVVPTIPDGVSAALERTLEGIAADAEAKVSEHLRAHHMEVGGQAWLARGLEYADDDCPFCGRDGLDGIELIQIYRGLFGEAYKQLRSDVETLRSAVDRSIGPEAAANLRNVEARNAGSAEFWARHCRLDPSSFPQLGAAADKLVAAHARLVALFNAKSERPLEAVGNTDELAAIGRMVTEVGQEVASYNEVVTGANATIERCKQSTAGGNLALVQAQIARLEMVARRHAPEGCRLCDEWRALDAEKRRLTEAKAAVRRQLEEHSAQVVEPYEAEINRFLRLFNAGFLITKVGHAYPGGVATSSYALQIDNIEVPLGDDRTPADRPAIQLNYHQSSGTKIMAFDLDTACRGRAAQELDDLLAFRANGAGNPREIIKKLRVVLETHFRTAYAGHFLPDDNLGDIIRKIREAGEAHPASGHLEDLNRINDYTADYHHGEDARGEAEPPLDQQELLGFVNQTLQVANAMPA
jgi:wobble nucleotide-excising tRNase